MIPDSFCDFSMHVRFDSRLQEELTKIKSGNDLLQIAKREGFPLQEPNANQLSGSEPFDISPCWDNGLDFHHHYYGDTLESLQDLIRKKITSVSGAPNTKTNAVSSFLRKRRLQKDISSLLHPVQLGIDRAIADLVRAHTYRILLGMPHGLYLSTRNDFFGWIPLSSESKRFFEESGKIEREISKVEDSHLLRLLPVQEAGRVFHLRDAGARLLQIIDVIEVEIKYKDKDMLSGIPAPRWVEQALSEAKEEYTKCLRPDDISVLSHSALFRDLPDRCKPLQAL